MRESGHLQIISCLAAAVVLLTVPWTTLAAPPVNVPTMLNFQGYLEDSSGLPISQNGATIVFSLYDAPSDGSLVWQETQPVDVNEGIFSVLLGAGGSPIAASDLIGDRYLGISVNGDPEMIPRKQLVSVAYAFWADKANAAYFLNAPGGGPTSAVHVADDGSVGIGTLVPDATLDVRGGIKVGNASLCDSSTEGTIRYNPIEKTLEFCNGTEWKQIEEVNRPPTQPVVQVTPVLPYTTDSLQCNFIVPSTDPDGDAVTYSYAWKKNGSGAVLNTSNTLPSGETTKTDVWLCEVTPDDGLDGGVGVPGSDQVTVINSPPPQAQIDIQPQPANTTHSLVCNIISQDPDADGDAITYTYFWEKNGVVQGGLTTNTVADSLTAKYQEWECIVTPMDGDIKGTESRALVTIVNTAPTTPSGSQLTPANPGSSDDLILSYDPSTDADGDTVYYEFMWYMDDGGGWLPFANNNAVLPSTATATDQLWTAKVRATDGEDVSPWSTLAIAVYIQP